MRVTSLPCVPGTSGWTAILPEEPARPPLESAANADWLVIGAGFAALSAARRLRQLRPDDTIAILDATRVASGPAGRNSGFMIDLPHVLQSADSGGAADDDRRRTALNRAAIAFAADAAAEYGMGEDASPARERSTPPRRTRASPTTPPTRATSPRSASRTPFSTPARWRSCAAACTTRAASRRRARR